MDSTTPSSLWQAVHTAYENRDLEEARRLLRNGASPLACSAILRCGDEDYVRWLLSHELITPPPDLEETWPELQERQLQCDALPESERPDCVINGEIKT